MTERKQAIAACLQFDGVYEDYPFDDNWTAMRHLHNKKSFAFIYRHGNGVQMNIKVLPEVGCYLRQHYAAVVPAYHMNKTHWVTVVLDGSLEDELIVSWLADSYKLTE